MANARLIFTAQPLPVVSDVMVDRTTVSRQPQNEAMHEVRVAAPAFPHVQGDRLCGAYAESLLELVEHTPDSSVQINHIPAGNAGRRQDACQRRQLHLGKVTRRRPKQNAEHRAHAQTPPIAVRQSTQFRITLEYEGGPLGWAELGKPPSLFASCADQ